MSAYHELARRVRTRIGQQHRYAHSVRVARSSEILAMRHGVSPQRARTAGMLHDLARLWPADALLEEAKRRNYPIHAFERRNPIVLHAPISAMLAAEEFDIRDPEIAEAIATHTLGAGSMSLLAKILYLGDALEPGRDFAERAALWDLALRDLNAAMAATLQNTLQYAAERNFEIAPQTRAALDSFQQRKPEVSPVQIA